MASTVLTGSGKISYTNNTGKNVRIIINYMSYLGPSEVALTVTSTLNVIGKNLAYYNSVPSTTITAGPITIPDPVPIVVGPTIESNLTSNNMSSTNIGIDRVEVYLGPNQTYERTCIDYNIVVIPEDG